MASSVDPRAAPDYGDAMPHVIVTGGAGFLGSHLCLHYAELGWRVTAIDNLSSGRLDNLAPVENRPGFTFIEADLRHAEVGVVSDVDLVLHFASPASPPHYLENPFLTLETGSQGTAWACSVGSVNDARVIVASTSEVYGDPLVHPQPESYWGNVNPIGPRSVYDEAKRYAEALTTAWVVHRGLNAGIIRIFNTYGPHMRPDDGRVITNFVHQALHGRPLTIYGDGTQTRSFCYVTDLVTGIAAMASSGERGPVNLGNPTERTMLDLANLVIELTGSSSTVEHRPLPVDDPSRRRPDISLAEHLLGWSPTTSLRDGLFATIDHARRLIPPQPMT